MSNHKQLPEGWALRRFDQMVQNINERILPEDAEGLPYVGLEHLDPESLRIRRWGSPDEVEAQKLQFYSGDIIFGKRRYYQKKLAVADFDGICSAHAMVLRAKPDVVSPEFLPFFMQSEMFFERAMAISVGSLSPTINWTALARQEFPLPPMDEQRRIAEILWAVEETIEGWVQSVLATRALKQAIVAQFILNPNDKPPTHDLVVGTFSSLAHIDPSRPRDLSDDDDVSFMAMADISDEGGIIDVWTRKFREVKQGYTYFEEGDILFAKITPCLENGKGAIATGLVNGIGFGSTEFFVLKPKIDSDRQFLYHMSQSSLLRRRAEIYMQGSAGQKRLPRSFFSNFRLLLPTVSEREIIGDQLTALNATIDHQMEQINKLKEIKLSYMREMWEQVDVQRG